MSVSVTASGAADAVGSVEVKMEEGRSEERADLGTEAVCDEDGDVVMSG